MRLNILAAPLPPSLTNQSQTHQAGKQAERPSSSSSARSSSSSSEFVVVFFALTCSQLSLITISDNFNSNQPVQTKCVVPSPRRTWDDQLTDCDCDWVWLWLWLWLSADWQAAQRVFGQVVGSACSRASHWVTPLPPCAPSCLLHCV